MRRALCVVSLSLAIPSLARAQTLSTAGQTTGALESSSPDGSYSYSIPIDAPPLHGLDPHPSLSYHSSAPIQWLGVGWSLSGVGAIERVSAYHGAPDYAAGDIWQLEGSDLVPCGTTGIDTALSPSCNNSDGITGGTYYVTKVESYKRIKW